MTKILLVGCGKMGGALLEGWLAVGHKLDDILIVDPSEQTCKDWHERITVVPAFEEIPANYAPDIILFAIKPQVMKDVAPPYRRYADALFVSIAAGKTTAWLDGLLGGGCSVVRVMPNTPAAVRRGVSAAYASPPVTPGQKTICSTLLQAVGSVIWLEDESLMDAVTAVSGSGPAYVFLLAECLTRAGIDAGLPPDTAALLARVTVTGAGELLHQADDDPATLRKNVTSPNGTTFAALQVLMAEDGMAPLLSKAVAAATARSRELAE